jgi:colanic acid biosynthesis glycosyl transferase WcaI
VRIAICDASGHPFQAQLSRELARRGHEVLHLYFAEFQTPRGRLSVQPDDPPTFAVAPVSLGRPFAKYSFVRRRFQEIEMGRRIAARIDAFAPDVVIGCNLAIDSVFQVARSCRTSRRPFVYWQQDIWSTAIDRILSQKFGVIGRILGAYYRRLERRVLAMSVATIVIADDFVTALATDFGLPTDNVHVIENWAPLDEISPRPKSNSWTRRHGLDNTEVVLYTGTIGMKHDPAKIFALANALRERPNTAVVVTSEGPAASWLANEARSAGLDNLRVLPFQPYEEYSDVLAAADILIAILEADAGTFSVPSKILSYLCAGRAIVLAAPLENLASRVVVKSGGGVAVSARDTGPFIEAVTSLLDDVPARNIAGSNGRNYAERSFDIRVIGDRFEAILMAATRPSTRRHLAEPTEKLADYIRTPVG